MDPINQLGRLPGHEVIQVNQAKLSALFEGVFNFWITYQDLKSRDAFQKAGNKIILLALHRFSRFLQVRLVRHSTLNILNRFTYAFMTRGKLERSFIPNTSSKVYPKPTTPLRPTSLFVIANQKPLNHTGGRHHRQSQLISQERYSPRSIACNITCPSSLWSQNAIMKSKELLAHLHDIKLQL